MAFAHVPSANRIVVDNVISDFVLTCDIVVSYWLFMLFLLLLKWFRYFRQLAERGSRGMDTYFHLPDDDRPSEVRSLAGRRSVADTAYDHTAHLDSILLQFGRLT